MNAQRVTVTADVFGESQSVSSFQATKGVGRLASCTINVHATGEAGTVFGVDGDEVATFTETLATNIAARRSIRPDFKVIAAASDGELEFEGFVVSASATAGADGQMSFKINAAEKNLMLASMSLGCYSIPKPQYSPTAMAQTSGAEAVHPLVLKMPAEPMDVKARILKLYELAKAAHVTSDPTNPVMIANARQIQINEQLESIFLASMERSVMAPEWLGAASPGLSRRVNNTLAHLLFSRRTLWEALLQIANMFQFDYVGDFKAPGYFRPLEIGRTTGPRVGLGGISSNHLVLGNSQEQTIAQIIAVAKQQKPRYRPAGSPVLPIQPAGKYPENIADQFGKVLLVQAPSFLTANNSLNIPTPVPPVPPLEEGITPEEAQEEAEEWKKKEKDLPSQKAQDTTAAVNSWCRDMFLRISTRNVRASIASPFVITTPELGTAINVGTSTSPMMGVLTEVTHALTISEQQGTASTSFGASYINATA